LIYLEITFPALFTIFSISTVSNALCNGCAGVGHCTLKSINDTCYHCICPSGFSGRCCEIHPRLGCDINPCNTTNTGEQHFFCTNLPHGQRLCSCENGWKGANCDQEVNGCDPNPCANSKSCESTENGGFQCNCKDNF